MYQVDAVWVITAADGSSVTLAGPRDFAATSTVFLLEDISGFDSPNVRQSVSDLPEQDGAVAGDFFFGSRPVTLKGRVLASTASARNLAVMGLQSALRGLRSDVTVTATGIDGLPDMQVSGRIDNVRVTPDQGMVKAFLISLICPDPLMYSKTLNTQSGTGSVASSGAAFPLVFPIAFGAGTGTVVSISPTNVGNFPSYPIVRITGPVTNPWLTNTTTGAIIYLDSLDLLTGEYVDIDMRAHTVVKSDATNQYGHVRFPDSSWIWLATGANVLELRSTSTTSSSTLTANWRDAWA